MYFYLKFIHIKFIFKIKFSQNMYNAEEYKCNTYNMLYVRDK